MARLDEIMAKIEAEKLAADEERRKRKENIKKLMASAAKEKRANRNARLIAGGILLEACYGRLPGSVQKLLADEAQNIITDPRIQKNLSELFTLAQEAAPEKGKIAKEPETPKAEAPEPKTDDRLI
jgi:hypothetical protein